ncbi:hypothetical protein [Streptomyces sp. GS7]|uniref:hypothetical protein n=1 Tax=Streptomyces sp. GS7 TaxID=2692234 RepID=UPI001317416C|nr:hypothetical protein [Streptomyces sp. GS7]QHC25639.1 hypothetical protein GR130_33890 [Streptomyces sp. GS7]
MSAFEQALLVNAAVLATTLLADLGLKKVTRKRLIRPLIIAAAIVPIFVTTLFTTGIGLTIEVVGAAAGVLLGVVAASRLTITRQTPDGAMATIGGWDYAAIWIAVSAARTLFSYGASYWFTESLGRWFVQHGALPTQVNAIVTDGLVLMAVAAVITRTVALRVRTRNAPATEPVISHPLGVPRGSR